MNRTNIQATIDILKLAQNFDINDFQQAADPDERTKYVDTVEELHVCGNTACIAGYVGISQAWKDFGGTVSYGVPRLRKGGKEIDTEDALARYWGLPRVDVEAIIYGGSGWPRFVATHRIKDVPDLWSRMTKDQAISLFEQLLALDAQGVTI
jgi:hypothetical protein